MVLQRIYLQQSLINKIKTTRITSSMFVIVITGLDPAGPEWDDHDVMAGVNPTSADFVDIIHTDGKSLIYPYGTMTPRGHMDFYPNGGETQPGCLTYYGGT